MKLFCHTHKPENHEKKYMSSQIVRELNNLKIEKMIQNIISTQISWNAFYFIVERDNIGKMKLYIKFVKNLISIKTKDELSFSYKILNYPYYLYQNSK